MIKKNRKVQIVENVAIKEEHHKGKFLADITKKIAVRHAVPGDILDIRLARGKKCKEGNIIKIHQKSQWRIDPFCQHFGVCGGCKWQNIDYSKQLEYKQRQVEDYFANLFPKEYVGTIIGNHDQKYYRNKLDFSFSHKKWFTEQDEENPEYSNGLGFHVEGRFDKVADIENCYLQISPSNEIRLAVRDYARKNNIEFHNSKTREGLLRSLMIRTTEDGEVMVVLVVEKNETSQFFPLLEHLKNSFSQITSIMYVVSDRESNSHQGIQPEVFSGQDHLIEKLGELKFRVGAQSFFQTNIKQCLKLYQKIFDFAQLQGDETIYDMYCGVGTITLFLARYVKKIIGIECLEQAVADAKINAQLNNIDNATFVCGDITKIFDNDSFPQQYGYPDLVVVDPAREGMRSKTTAQLLRLHPKKIIYVSCNPKTQMEDIEILTTKYEIIHVQPIDMFPHTPHIENIVLLKSKYT